MIGYFLIFRIVLIDLFFAGYPFAAYCLRRASIIKHTCHPEPIHAILHTVLLIGAEVTLGVAQVINSIQQIGLTAAIGTGNAGNTQRKCKCSR